MYEVSWTRINSWIHLMSWWLSLVLDYSDIAIDILENVDKALMKYNFDTTACTQRVVCWYIKESIANVVERKASQMDKIVEGMIR